MHADLERQPILARWLRELPDEAACPYGFAEFERRARERARAAHRVRPAWSFAVVIAAGVLALSLRFAGLGPPTRAPALRVEVAIPELPPTPEPATPAPGTELMEQWLASLPQQPALVRVGTRAAVTGLEDRIAQVDDLLSAAGVEPAKPARLAALQQERTRLVGTLLQVRYAETLADASP